MHKSRPSRLANDLAARQRAVTPSAPASVDEGRAEGWPKGGQRRAGHCCAGRRRRRAPGEGIVKSAHYYHLHPFELNFASESGQLRKMFAR